jgi:hypothetical protein
VFRNCKNLIRTLAALPYSERDHEDLDTDAEAHAVDVLQYGLVWENDRSARVHVPGLQRAR